MSIICINDTKEIIFVNAILVSNNELLHISNLDEFHIGIRWKFYH